MTTLNQVVTKLKAIAEAQGQVNHVYYGHPLDWYDELQKDRGNFPAVCISVGEPRMGTGMLVFDFTIWVATWSSVDVEGHSDSVQILGDIFSDVSHPDLDWYPQSEELRIELFDEDDNEQLVTGCKANISIGVRFVRDRCQIPGGYTTGGDLTTKSMKVYDATYTATGGETSFTFTEDIVNKYILYVGRGGIQHERITSGDPTDLQVKYTAATETFEVPDTNPLAPGEKVTILYRNI